MPRTTYETLFQNACLLRLSEDGQRALIGVASREHKDIIEDRYHRMVRNALGVEFMQILLR